MSSPECFRATVQIGDVVQLGRIDAETERVVWGHPSVVMDAAPSALNISTIVYDDYAPGVPHLTTVGTEQGIVRQVVEAERWTPTQAALAMIEGMSTWGDRSATELNKNNYALARLTAALIDNARTELIERAAGGPVEYCYTPRQQTISDDAGSYSQ